MSPASSGGDDVGQLARGAKLLEQRVGTGRGEQLVEEGVDGGARPRPGELRDDPAVPERLHRRDAADGEPLREGRVGVDIDLDERDGARPSPRRRPRARVRARGTGRTSRPRSRRAPDVRPTARSRRSRTSPRSRPRRHALPETTTSAAQPAIRAASTCSGATPASERWSGSTAIRGQASSCRARAPSAEPISSSCGRREHAASAGLAARDALELAELLERVDPHVRVRPDAERDRRGRGPRRRGGSRRRDRPRSSGRRRCAHRCAASEVELLVVRVGRVDDRRPLAEAARVGEELDRAAAVLVEALLDLARLLVGMDVEWQPLAALRSGRSPRARRASRRGRSGGRPRPRCRPRAATRPRSR